MEKQKRKSAAIVILQNIGWPLFWGSSLTAGFYALTHNGIIESEILHRYFASHPVQYFETALFFIGVSALCLKILDAIGQFGTVSQIEIMQRPEDGQPVAEARGMLTSLGQLPNDVRKGLLARRLEEVLQFVARKGTARGLDAELTRLSDLDAARQHDGFALVRIIIWATPMLGFLGTVIGITLALADLSPQALVSTPETAMEGLLAGLAVAFDTTALALVLAILLMFAQFVTNRLEIELLELVDRRVSAEMVGRFRSDDVPLESSDSTAVESMQQITQMLGEKLAEISLTPVSETVEVGAQQKLIEAIDRLTESQLPVAELYDEDNDDQQLNERMMEVLERLAERPAESTVQPAADYHEALSANYEALSANIVDAVEQLVERQTQLWSETIEEAQGVWCEAARSATAEVQASMSEEFSASAQRHSDAIVHEQTLALKQLEDHWEQLQAALSQNAHIMQHQQAELVRQGDALLKTVGSIDHVTQLQDSLDQNLARMVASSSLNETMMSLNSAINLLNARLTPVQSEQMRIYKQQQRGQAA